jgi:type VI secretion system secreted protein VgrG
MDLIRTGNGHFGITVGLLKHTLIIAIFEVNSMATYTQAHRPIAIETPLGKDVLLLTGIRGQEAISQLFNFQVDLLAESKNEIRFDRIIGEDVTVELELPNKQKRYFNGLVNRFSQGARDEIFVHFRAELVPKLWLLTKTFRSRIFQHLSVPDILRQVLQGFDVTYEISGTYYPRDYCVQYRESDFDFASRLMEEEGIYYFFKHGDGSHQMVTTDLPNHHPDLSGQSDVIYDEVSGGSRKDMRITAWEKSQELRSGQYTLWDHCFEIPTNHLTANKKTIDSVVVGEVTHKLSVGGNDQLEIYDFPGGYAQRFDGVNPSGAPSPQDLRNVFPDSERTVRVRMEQEETTSLQIAGASDCGHFVSGHQFTLKRHFDGNDRYLLTSVEHNARLDGNYRSSQAPAFHYENQFTCIPVGLPYRAQRVTPKPVIAGAQTATVVGPEGEEIFCDKYGRVKVQFHWDREGKKDANSSCWLRVAQVWAGKNWGACFWPRVGHEVVVIFEEGDPDQPLIIGSVYNAENMPPFELPKKKKLTGFKSASYRGTPSKNFSGIVINDNQGHEHLAIHSERHMSLNSEFDKVFRGGRHKGERVAVSNVFTVGHFPSGGGSGGGPMAIPAGGGSGGAIGAPLGTPKAQGLFGLNSTMVYGENVQTAVGINHQLAVGSNYQICVNPAGLLSQGFITAGEPILVSALGGGIGGNVQFTIGTNAQITYGRSFEINVGAPKIELNNSHQSENTASYLLCGLVGLLVLTYVVCYGIFDDDDIRANLTIAFQACLDIAFGVLLCMEGLKQQTGPDSEEAEKLRKMVFEFNHVDWTVPVETSLTHDEAGNLVGKAEWSDGFFGLTPDAWEIIGAAPAALGVAIVPLVVAAQNENPTDDDTQS